MIFLSAAIAVAVTAGAGAYARPALETALLDKAYAAIAAGRNDAARTYLLKADAVAPSDPLPRKELFYVDLSLKRSDEAFAQARKAQALGMLDDAFKLDVAYALVDAGRTSDADVLLQALSTSSDGRVRSAAVAQLATDASDSATDAPLASSSADGTQPVDTDLQAAYDADDRGDHGAALASLDAYLSRAPGDDAARLQRDYELIALGRGSDADKELATLAHSGDAGVAAHAREQLAADRDQAGAGSSFTYFQHESRFGGSFYGADARVALGHGTVQPYLALHAANDVGTSANGVLRQTLTDQVAALDIGIRMPAGNGGWAFAEAGEGFGLAGQAGVEDARYGYEFDKDWGTAQGPRPHSSFDLSAAAYSRYAGNAIGYAQFAHDFALVGPLRGVVEANLAADTRRLFFDNTAEAAAGISVGSQSLSVRFLTVKGIYTPRGAGLPSPAAYATARTQLLLGFSF